MVLHKILAKILKIFDDPWKIIAKDEQFSLCV